MTRQFYLGLFTGLSVAAVFAYAAYITYRRNKKVRKLALPREFEAWDPQQSGHDWKEAAEITAYKMSPLETPFMDAARRKAE